MTRADLIKQAEIEEALAEWFRRPHGQFSPSCALDCKAQATALCALADQS